MDVEEHEAMSSAYAEIATAYNNLNGFTSVDPEFISSDDVSNRLKLRRNYVDGIKAILITECLAYLLVFMTDIGLMIISMIT